MTSPGAGRPGTSQSSLAANERHVITPHFPLSVSLLKARLTFFEISHVFQLACVRVRACERVSIREWNARSGADEFEILSVLARHRSEEFRLQRTRFTRSVTMPRLIKFLRNLNRFNRTVLNRKSYFRMRQAKYSVSNYLCLCISDIDLNNEIQSMQ